MNKQPPQKPRLPVTGPHTAKDQAKWDRANKMIARGSGRSSSHRYAQAAGPLANSGTYAPTDVVFVSAEGNRSGRVDPDWAELGRAVRAGASFVTDIKAQRDTSYNRVGEGRVAAFLEGHGYTDDGTGLWRHDRAAG